MINKTVTYEKCHDMHDKGLSRHIALYMLSSRVRLSVCLSVTTCDTATTKDQRPKPRTTSLLFVLFERKEMMMTMMMITIINKIAKTALVHRATAKA